MYVDTVIEICPPEVFQGLAKKGMEKADDRLQCSKTYTLSATWVCYLKSVVFRQFKAVSLLYFRSAVLI